MRRRATDGIAVAGTATSLAAVDQELEPYDASRVDGYLLELGACEHMLAMLATKTLDERREVSGLHPGRAPTIVAGAVILVEAMRAFALDAVRVSEADLLHGAALEECRELSVIQHVDPDGSSTRGEPEVVTLVSAGQGVRA
ncbi:MAG: hypothetical protein WKF31_12135 [Thermoleophilaceae bacterium]